MCKCFYIYIYNWSLSRRFISKALKKFSKQFCFPPHYHTTNHLRRNISLFKTEGEADEAVENSEKQ